MPVPSPFVAIDLTTIPYRQFLAPQRDGQSVVIAGTAWGDEGKGKEVDCLAPHADYVVRYAGGGNAGHTIVVDGKELILHVLPSGVMSPDARIVLADGVVTDPADVVREITQFQKDIVTGSPHLNLEGRLFISENADLVTSFHREEDIRHENSGRGVGSTKNGIRPAYEDRAGRRAVTYGDILYRPVTALEQLTEQARHWMTLAHHADTISFPLNETKFASAARRVLETLGDSVKALQGNHVWIGDTSKLLAQARDHSRNILYEGAQGTLLDVRYGTYRDVTSSHPTAGGVCVGAGVPPGSIDEVVGVVKVVMTRVGRGPFPSELVDETLQWKQVMAPVLMENGISIYEYHELDIGKQRALSRKAAASYHVPEGYAFLVSKAGELREAIKRKDIPDKELTILTGTLSNFARSGSEDNTFEDALDHVIGMVLMEQAGEFGATTGRPRRTGWLDIPALRYAIRINGISGLALTKLDSLGDIPEVRLVTGYRVNGTVLDEIPLYQLDRATPLLETLPGWKRADVQNAGSFSELPENAQHYVRRIAELTSTRIYSIGVGRERHQTIELHNPFTGEGIYGKR